LLLQALLLHAFGPDFSLEEDYSETTQWRVIETPHNTLWRPCTPPPDILVTAGLWSGLHPGGGVLRDFSARGGDPALLLLTVLVTAGLWSGLHPGGGVLGDHSHLVETMYSGS